MVHSKGRQLGLVIDLDDQWNEEGDLFLKWTLHRCGLSSPLAVLNKECGHPLFAMGYLLRAGLCSIS